MLPATSMAQTGGAGTKPTLLVTGANSGIGEAVAAYLGGNSCNVILACRTADKAEAALQKLSQQVPGGSFEAMEVPLDFSDLSSVKPFAQAVRRSRGSLKGVVHCAGIDGAPDTRTPQGLELHMATNHLGPFALTAELLPLLRAHPTPSVISLTSSAALDLNPEWLSDLNWKNNAYNKRAAYCLSKACNVLFIDELARREPSLFAASLDPGPTISQIVRYELPKRAEQRRAMTPLQLRRQAKQLGFRTPAEAAVQPSLLALQLHTDSAPPLLRGAWYLGIAAPPGSPGPPLTEPLPWRTPASSAKVWAASAALVAAYLSDPSTVA